MPGRCLEAAFRQTVPEENVPALVPLLPGRAGRSILKVKEDIYRSLSSAKGKPLDSLPPPAANTKSCDPDTGEMEQREGPSDWEEPVTTLDYWSPGVFLL